MAPPIIPVTIMPENEPWCSLTEFKAKENIMGYITEAKNPTIGKAIKAIEEVPNNATVKLIMASPVNVIPEDKKGIVQMFHVYSRLRRKWSEDEKQARKWMREHPEEVNRVREKYSKELGL